LEPASELYRRSADAGEGRTDTTKSGAGAPSAL